jgi:Ser/Thr protein kinase RdoA (MazF antagonist)
MSPESSTDSTRNLAVRQVLTGYSGLPQPTQLVALQSAGGFSGAELWRVETPAGMFALRAMPADLVNLNRLKGLHRLLAHLRDRGGLAQVAVPLRRGDGATHVVAHGSVWQLEPWMPGVADFAVHPSAERLHGALALLARWHLGARTFIPNESEAIWFASSAGAPSPGIRERAERIAFWNAPRCALVRDRLQRRDWPAFDALGLRVLDLYRDAAPRVAAELELGRRVTVAMQPVLRDIWHDHLLFTGDDVTGLIDAHASRFDNVATDLARLLGSLVADDRPLWEEGLAVYEAVRPLSIAERGLVELFDRSAVLLSGLTWLEWKCLEKRRFDRPDAVLARLEGIVRRMERLAAN